MNRNLEIDRLRSLGALIVIFCHLIYVYYPDMIDFTNGFATTIIDLYFVISGYVISCVLIRPIDQLKADQTKLIPFFKGFFIKRIFRIYPCLWATFFLIVVLSYFVQGSSFFSNPAAIFQSSLLLLTSTFNFYFTDKYYSLALAPLWSLAIEEQFYIIFPFFILFTKNNRQRAHILIGALLLITFAFRPLTLHYYGKISLFFTQTRCDSIIYGVLVYLLSQQPWFNLLKPQAKRNPWLGTAFVTLFLYVIIGITTLGYSFAVFLPINCLFVSILLTSAVFERGFISFPLLIQNILDRLAPRAYSLYMVHFPVILVMNAIFSSYTEITPMLLMIKAPLTLFLIFSVSEVLYQYVLIPSLNKGKTIADAMMSKPADNGTDQPLVNIDFATSEAK